MDYKNDRSGGKRSYNSGSRFAGKSSYGDQAEGKTYGDRKGGYKSEGYKSEGSYKKYDRDGKSEGKAYGDRKGGYKSEGYKSEGGYKKYDKGSKPAYGDKGEGKTYGDRKGGYKSEGYKSEGGYKKFDRDGKPAYGDKGSRSYGDKAEGKTYGKGEGFKKERTYDNRKSYAENHGKGPKASPATESTAPSQVGGEDELPFLLMGRNAVKEAVKSGRSIDKILTVSEPDGSLREIIGLARDAKIQVREVDRRKLDELCMPFGHGGKTANHQGIVAYAAGMEYCEVSDILSYAKERGEEPFIVVLDGVEDPHNLGSIIRSAECAGAHGVVIGKRRSASVTAAAVKAAAGATSYMRVARVVNVSGALEEMKRAGLWIAGADMAGVSMHDQGLNGALALVIGNEGSGLTKLVKDTCDFLVSIPMQGRIDSLNAGVAAGILMFEKRRQDRIPDGAEG